MEKKETVKKESAEEIVVTPEMMAKYPEPSESQKVRDAEDAKNRLETRHASLVADKATLLNLREKLAVYQARSKEKAEEDFSDLESAIDELKEKIAEEEAELAELA